MTDDRAERAFTDVAAVEQMAPGMVRVVTFGGAYIVDARDAGCNCPDKEYHDAPMCKHEYAALAADVEGVPSPVLVADSLTERAIADGGRPEDCNCKAGDDLACFECYAAGFKNAPEATSES